MTVKLSPTMLAALRYYGDPEWRTPTTPAPKVGTLAALVTRGLLNPAPTTDAHTLTDAGTAAHCTAEAERLGYANVAAYLAAPGRTAPAAAPAPAADLADDNDQDDDAHTQWSEAEEAMGEDLHPSEYAVAEDLPKRVPAPAPCPADVAGYPCAVHDHAPTRRERRAAARTRPGASAVRARRVTRADLVARYVDRLTVRVA